MRNPFRSKRDKVSYDAHRPHPFQEARDAGLAAFSAGGGLGGRGSSNLTQVAMTSAYVRTEHCGVPGCGKDPSDEIHAPEE